MAGRWRSAVNGQQSVIIRALGRQLGCVAFSESGQAAGMQGLVWLDWVRLGEESFNHITVELNLQTIKNCRT